MPDPASARFLPRQEVPVPWRAWPTQLRWFLLPFALFTCLSLASAALQVHQHQASSLMDAMFPGLIDGRDLSGFRNRFQFYGTTRFFSEDTRDFADSQSFNYAAPLAVITRLLFLLSADPVPAVRAMLALWLVVLAIGFTAACRRRGASAMACALLAVVVLTISFPVVVLALTANLEVFVWIAGGAGVWAWFAGREQAAAASFGLAASMKYFPALLLGAFLSPPRWRALLTGLMVFLGVLLTGLLLFGLPVPVVWHGLQHEMARFGEHYLLHWQRNDNAYDHSVFGVVKLVLVASGHEAALPTALRIYVAAVALALPALYFLRIRLLGGLDQIIALNLLCIWVTPMSQDYTLVHLLVPFGCLLLDRLHRGWKPNDPLRLACFGSLFAAVTFVHLGPARLGGNLKAVVLGVLLAAMLRSTRADEREVSRATTHLAVPHPTWAKRCCDEGSPAE